MMFISSRINGHIESLWPVIARPTFTKSMALLTEMSERPQDIDKQNCILIIESFSTDSAIHQAHSEGFDHFIPLDHPYFAMILEQTCKIIDDPQAFLHSPENYLLDYSRPIAPILSEFQPITNVRQKFTSTEEKSIILSNLSGELQKQNATRIIHEYALSIVDEMLMNALFDAPRESGSAKKPPAEFFYVTDNCSLLLGCVDYYGSLNTKKLMARLNTVFTTGMGQAMNMGSGGAGIGLTIALEQGLDFVAVCERGQRTLFIVTLPLGYSRKKMAQLSKSVRFFEF